MTNVDVLAHELADIAKRAREARSAVAYILGGDDRGGAVVDAEANLS